VNRWERIHVRGARRVCRTIHDFVAAAGLTFHPLHRRKPVMPWASRPVISRQCRRKLNGFVAGAAEFIPRT